ncbi:uncharacterized protein LOC126611428 isoform X1 [Malus sylvestris]|uniref:uncharacterized protein LOC126611428 isoform X1 n=1 Tax=Malus sylvestris TaxID=3752 RepID=UPI0021ABC3EE|nr:uncharacterized protein LOC126611428 isoform X1 [Malus sylvestris]XP_050135675.1 uncharacterized protein LOC126611428 isoform X1 [Malus sylvestris]XP_050135676.1 uncharacterized protein LOC126611428 isoform X1 [Malus sylvestris]
MDDLSINLPVTHEITKPEERNPRRNSTGKIFSLNTGEKNPHYLRASTGSCHDYCKYGRKHEEEVKARCPIKSVPRRLPTKSPSTQNSEESTVIPERKNVSVVKIKPSPDLKTLLPDLKTLLPDTCNITRQQVSKKLTDSQSSVGSVHLAESKKTSSAKPKLSSCLKPHVNAAPKTMKQEVSSSSDSCSKPHFSVAPKIMKQEGSSSSDSCSKTHVPAAPKIMKHEASSSSDSCSKPHVSAAPKIMKQEVSPSPDKLEVSSKNGSIGPKEKNLSVKHVTCSKPKSLAVKEVPSPDTSRGLTAPRNRNSMIGQRTGTSFKIKSSALKQVSSPESAGGLKGKSNSDGKIGKRTGASLVTLKRVLSSPRASLSPKPSLRRVASLKARQNRPVNVVSPLKNQNKTRKAQPKQVNSDEVQEKTLYVIKVETENSKPPESDQNRSCEVEPSPHSASSTPKSVSVQHSLSFSSHEGEDQGSGYTMSETEVSSFSEDNEVDYIDNAEILGEDGKGKPRKSGMVCSEDKDGETLKFRRGKVVDIQSENSNPRRLKFRRGIVLGDNQNVKAVSLRRSFKKRGVGADTVGTEPGAEKVVLRHQDVHGKKDEKGLFNNVIEETASKLAETRKSKVKALVGAFETVISLQEHKPSANAVA